MGAYASCLSHAPDPFPCAGPRANARTYTVTPVFRNIAVPPARAPLLLKDCHLYAIELSILAQTPLVALRRFLVLPLCRAPALMDHSHADHLGFYNAVDVLPRPSLPGSSSSSLDICIASGVDAGSRLLAMWWRSQAADHIYTLTVIFTLLVVIAATQGKGFRWGLISVQYFDAPLVARHCRGR